MVENHLVLDGLSCMVCSGEVLVLQLSAIELRSSVEFRKHIFHLVLCDETAPA